ncbi:MAG: transposase [Thermodesulfovibrio sp.]|nr:transposase [Thermodesulfovibrio sp.]
MRLGEEVFYEILLNLIAQAVCLIKNKNLKLSIDSSHIEAFNNDKDAKWGYKSKDFSFFGYKVHLEVTQGAFPIPVSVKVTEGNKWDGQYLVELTESACKHLSDKGKNIKAVIADAGYDSVKTAKYLLQKNITPIIAQGKLLCPAGVELCYWGRKHKRGRIKFRCGFY